MGELGTQISTVEIAAKTFLCSRTRIWSDRRVPMTTKSPPGGWNWSQDRCSCSKDQAVSKEDSYPQAILKLLCYSSLDYRSHHGLLKSTKRFQRFPNDSRGFQTILEDLWNNPNNSKGYLKYSNRFQKISRNLTRFQRIMKHFKDSKRIKKNP